MCCKVNEASWCSRVIACALCLRGLGVYGTADPTVKGGEGEPHKHKMHILDSFLMVGKWRESWSESLCCVVIDYRQWCSFYRLRISRSLPLVNTRLPVRSAFRAANRKLYKYQARSREVSLFFFRAEQPERTSSSARYAVTWCRSLDKFRLHLLGLIFKYRTTSCILHTCLWTLFMNVYIFFFRYRALGAKEG